MSTPSFISLEQICKHYEVDRGFVMELVSYGLVVLRQEDEQPVLEVEMLNELECLLRLHRELSINAESLDVITHLLRRIQTHQEEIRDLRSRLQALEDHG